MTVESIDKLTMTATNDSSKLKRKHWTEENMEAAVNSIRYKNKGLWEAARLYNIPVETLRRHANGHVEAGSQAQALSSQLKRRIN